MKFTIATEPPAGYPVPYTSKRRRGVRVKMSRRDYARFHASYTTDAGIMIADARTERFFLTKKRRANRRMDRVVCAMELREHEASIDLDIAEMIKEQAEANEWYDDLMMMMMMEWDNERRVDSDDDREGCSCHRCFQDVDLELFDDCSFDPYYSSEVP